MPALGKQSPGPRVVAEIASRERAAIKQNHCAPGHLECRIVVRVEAGQLKSITALKSFSSNEVDVEGSAYEIVEKGITHAVVEEGSTYDDVEEGRAHEVLEGGSAPRVVEECLTQRP